MGPRTWRWASSRGWAAPLTLVSALGPIVLCMAQEWWTGPVAAAGTGDIAMVVSCAYSVGAYALARSLELRCTARRRSSSSNNNDNTSTSTSTASG